MLKILTNRFPNFRLIYFQNYNLNTMKNYMVIIKRNLKIIITIDNWFCGYMV